MEKCWSCGVPLEQSSAGKIGFRATCPACDAWIHCCLGCRYYQSGRSNDCLIPGTERISDRSNINFCEDFKILLNAPKQSPQDKAKQSFDALFE